MALSSPSGPGRATPGTSAGGGDAGRATLSSRAVAKVFFTLVGFSAGLYLLYLVREVIGMLLIAVFLAVALGPAVDFFHRRKVPRVMAILFVYLLILLTIVGVGALVVPPIVDQVSNVARDAPGYIDDIRANSSIREFDDQYQITEKLQEQAASLPSKLGAAAGALQSVTVGAFTAGAQLIAVLTIAFLLLLQGRRLTEFGFDLLPVGSRERYRTVGTGVYQAVSGYVAGNLIISVIAGLLTYLTLTILDVPFAAPLSILMAFLDLIPLIGATIGGVIIALVTLFADFPTATVVWLVVFISYQQAENHLVQPIVYRKTVDVPPLLVIVSILIGATLLGVLGALVAIPVAATMQIFIKDWWERRRSPIEVPSTSSVEMPDTLQSPKPQPGEAGGSS